MRATNVMFVVTLTPLILSGGLGAQTLQNAWPAKIQLQEVQVESSAPVLLPPGAYTLDLQKTGNRFVGRLRQGNKEVPTPFRLCSTDATA